MGDPNGARYNPPLQADSTRQRFGLVRALTYPVARSTRELGVELTALEVRVTAVADVRGTMALNADVPVGFQSMRCDVDLKVKDGTAPELLQKLRVAAERCCVVQQTLRNPPPVQTTFRF